MWTGCRVCMRTVGMGYLDDENLWTCHDCHEDNEKWRASRKLAPLHKGKLQPVVPVLVPVNSSVMAVPTSPSYGFDYENPSTKIAHAKRPDAVSRERFRRRMKEKQNYEKRRTQHAIWEAANREKRNEQKRKLYAKNRMVNSGGGNSDGDSVGSGDMSDNMPDVSSDDNAMLSGNRHRSDISSADEYFDMFDEDDYTEGEGEKGEGAERSSAEDSSSSSSSEEDNNDDNDEERKEGSDSNDNAGDDSKKSAKKYGWVKGKGRIIPKQNVVNSRRTTRASAEPMEFKALAATLRLRVPKRRQQAPQQGGGVGKAKCGAEVGAEVEEAEEEDCDAKYYGCRRKRVLSAVPSKPKAFLHILLAKVRAAEARLAFSGASPSLGHGAEEENARRVLATLQSMLVHQLERARKERGRPKGESGQWRDPARAGDISTERKVEGELGGKSVEDEDEEDEDEEDEENGEGGDATYAKETDEEIDTSDSDAMDRLRYRYYARRLNQAMLRRFRKAMRTLNVPYFDPPQSNEGRMRKKRLQEENSKEHAQGHAQGYIHGYTPGHALGQGQLVQTMKASLSDTIVGPGAGVPSKDKGYTTSSTLQSRDMHDMSSLYDLWSAPLSMHPPLAMHQPMPVAMAGSMPGSALSGPLSGGSLGPTVTNPAGRPHAELGRDTLSQRHGYGYGPLAIHWAGLASPLAPQLTGPVASVAPASEMGKHNHKIGDGSQNEKKGEGEERYAGADTEAEQQCHSLNSQTAPSSSSSTSFSSSFSSLSASPSSSASSSTTFPVPSALASTNTPPSPQSPTVAAPAASF